MNTFNKWDVIRMLIATGMVVLGGWVAHLPAPTGDNAFWVVMVTGPLMVAVLNLRRRSPLEVAASFASWAMVMGAFLLGYYSQ